MLAAYAEEKLTAENAKRAKKFMPGKGHPQMNADESR